ncbi:MAG: radical SAM protein [Clostridia bacterium]|nr:radical SAM protein [Clostridia bacterium]
MSERCSACPRRCNADRDVSPGFCKTGSGFRAARAALHFWEEPCISGTNGSGTVFFSGCNLKCVYCQNYEVSHNCFGKDISDERLLRIFSELKAQGAHNINLVNPTHYAKRLAPLLKANPVDIPVVYNTSGYESVETLKELAGAVDIYLTDLKYYDPEISKKYSMAEDYFDTAFSAIKEMKTQQPRDVFDKNGIMQKGVIIRNLILPGNISQSIKVLDVIAETFGTDTIVSLMSQYTPFGEAKNLPPLNRRITKREYKTVVKHLDSLGFENVFVQELSSAKEEYIPPFDLTGV